MYQHNLESKGTIANSSDADVFHPMMDNVERWDDVLLHEKEKSSTSWLIAFYNRSPYPFGYLA
jgi:hypothetical protein